MVIRWLGLDKVFSKHLKAADCHTPTPQVVDKFSPRFVRYLGFILQGYEVHYRTSRGYINQFAFSGVLCSVANVHIIKSPFRSGVPKANLDERGRLIILRLQHTERHSSGSFGTTFYHGLNR